jgi:hypothetical protein
LALDALATMNPARGGCRPKACQGAWLGAIKRRRSRASTPATQIVGLVICLRSSVIAR